MAFESVMAALGSGSEVDAQPQLYLRVEVKGPSDLDAISRRRIFRSVLDGQMGQAYLRARSRNSAITIRKPKMDCHPRRAALAADHTEKLALGRTRRVSRGISV